MLCLNILALTELTYRFASEMVKRRTGHILLIASFLGYQPTPGYAAYAASKGYVLLFGEALHAELKPHGVCDRSVARCNLNVVRRGRQTEEHTRDSYVDDASPGR